MDLNQITPTGTRCLNCGATVSETDKFCTKCGFPVKGTEEEQGAYRYKIEHRKKLLKDANQKIRRARTTLYIMAGLCFLAGLFFSFSDNILDGVVYLILALFYLIMVAWSNRQPFAAMPTSLIVFITIQLLSAIVDPVYLFKGIIIKVVIVIAFVRGVQSAKDAQRLNEELSQFNAKPFGAE